MLDKAGYDGGRIAFMHPTDQIAYDALSTVAVDAFRKVGLNIDDQQTDWGTILQRRNSKAPLDKGGWSMFPGGAPGGDFVDPLAEGPVRSNGAQAWVGWPDDPHLEALYEAWIDAPDDADTAAAGTRVSDRGVSVGTDNPAGAISAARSLAVERDRAAEGIGTGFLGGRKGVVYMSPSG